MKLAIIIPTRNRKENLLCVLESLSNQTHVIDQVIVVDDRSNDGTIDIPFHTSYPKLTIKYLRNDKETGWNASIPRNLGVNATLEDIELLWFLDSDVILPPDAVEKTLQAFESGNTKRVLIGSYHWLRGQDVTPVDVRERFDQVITNSLPLKQVNHPMTGQKDIRQLSFDKADTSQDMFYSFTDALACFGGYLVIPKKIFLMAGGYDENIGAGCEDGDFGITLYEMGVHFSYLKETCGYHLAHNWPQGRDMNEVKRNVQLLDEKHQTNLIHQSGKAYREWGIDWNPPAEFYDNDPEKLKQWKKDWQTEKLDFMMKVNKV